MQGEKQELTVKAAERALSALRPSDRFSVVVYNETITVLSPSTPASPSEIASARAALNRIFATGYTDLGAGWLTGCAQIGDAASQGALGRCLLLTDGLANRGITAPLELERHATELRRRGVTTSTVGVGVDVDEVLLRRLSDAGGGAFYFAGSARQIPTLFAEEIGEALQVVAREAVLRIRASEEVDVSSLNEDPCTRQGDTFVVNLGSLRGGQVCTRVLALELPAGPVGSEVSVEVSVSDADGALNTTPSSVSWRRAHPQECADEAPDVEVLRDTAHLDAARARTAALNESRRGNTEGSVSVLLERARLIRSDSAGDASVIAIADQLARESEAYARPMSPMDVKLRYMKAYKFMKGPSPFATSAAEKKTVHVYGLDLSVFAAVQEAWGALSAEAAIHGIDLVLVRHSKFTPPFSATLTFDQEKAILEAFDPNETLAIAFLENAHFDNFFSHWHPDRRVALISMHDWSAMSTVPAAAMAAYEMVVHALRVLSPAYDPQEFWHVETRGCLFDFCRQKQELEIKLQAGHVCEACESKLASANIPVACVHRLVSVVQGLAHARPVYPAHV
jgi:Ca-activated chloride channel family protein